ncbi:ALS2 C-terminal-like protein [Schistosoma japonicum]|nr:ALS2 C-terminal-like protein [Schistosoma japonicum]
MCEDLLTASVWKTLPSEIRLQLFHPDRHVLLDSRVHSICIKNTNKFYSPNKRTFSNTTNKLYPFIYSEMPLEVEYSSHTDHDNIINNNISVNSQTVTFSRTPVTFTGTSVLNPSLMVLQNLDNPFNLDGFSEQDQTSSLKCLQSEANPPHFILFNDGLFIRLTKQMCFRFWPTELIWIKMDEKISDSEFELRTPEGVYKLDSSLWHAVLLKTIRHVCTNYGELCVNPSSPRNHDDIIRESNSLLEQRCCIYHVFRSGPLEDFAYYGSWMNGELHGSGKLCWPGKKFNSLHASKYTNSTKPNSSETLLDTYHLQHNDSEEFSSNRMISDSLRLFLAFTGPLDVNMKYIENEVVSVFCVGEFQSNQLTGLGELCIQTTQGSINIRAEWENGRPHGIGSLRSVNGDIYTGWFVNGSREGHGSQELFPLNNAQNIAKCTKRTRRPNDCNTTYLGDWKGNKQDGYGILKYATNGNVYAGQWVKNATCGRGILYQLSGVYVAGEFEANGINGQGICVTPEGNIYSGMLSKSQPKGKGILNILSSNLLLVGNFSGIFGSSIIHRKNCPNSAPQNNNTNNSLYFKGDIIYSDRVLGSNSTRIISGGSYCQRLRVPFLVMDSGSTNGNWKICDRIEAVLNEVLLLHQIFGSSLNLTHLNQTVEIRTLSRQDFVELAMFILSHTVPFHLRWNSLFRNCIINATVLSQSISSSCLTDCIITSVENSPNAVNKHIELIAELAYWCLPSYLGGMASNSIDELLCHLLSELHIHKMHNSPVSSTYKDSTPPPLWLKYLRIINCLLTECFHTTICISNSNNNVENLLFSKSSQLAHLQMNYSYSQINYSTHLNIVIVLTEYAHLVIQLAQTFSLAIQHRLSTESIFMPVQSNDVNYLFQICDPSINYNDFFTTSNETSTNMGKIDEEVAVSTIDHHCPTGENDIVDETERRIVKEHISVNTERLILYNLAEVQLTGCISLFELACDCLLPSIYSTLFEFFKAQYANLDRCYWTFRQTLHDKSDSILYSYLELDKNLWLWDTSASSRNSVSSVSEHCSAFNPAVNFLRELCHRRTPAEKLLIIYQTFASVDHIISKSKQSTPHPQTMSFNNECKSPSICSTDTLPHLPGLDQLLPIMQFVVIRSEIMYLGAELAFIEQLAPERLSLHGLLPYLMTTLQACYDQILREGYII